MSEIEQTRRSFGAKWNGAAGYQIGGAQSFDDDTLQWVLNRNGFGSLDEFGGHLERFSSVLDAGCGNGRILGLMADLVSDGTRLYGLDFSAADVARANLRERVSEIHDADLTDKSSLEGIEPVEFIYCQEVLHHTSDPELSFRNLVDLLLPGGEIAIYVYKKKAPIREFTDDFVRGLVEGLNSADAMKHAAEFSELGRVLSVLDVEFDAPAVSSLGIPAGRYTVQRFLYHFFVKCYWNPELSTEHNDMVNFDWYHPSLCSRHTPEEVLGWFESSDLKVIHSCVDDYGITVRGLKS